MTTIKLSVTKSEKHFDLEVASGETVELKVVEFTVADIIKVVELQKPLFNGASSKKMTALEVNKLMCARMVCCVKRRDNNEHYWNLSDIEEFDFNEYPSTLLKAIATMVDEVNPVVNDIEGEKKSS
ncbi:hypothetical protein NVP2044O_16 [Vibrio phage 2.044.O._10N.261.51.B8]|nr:hypothetical protein NVP2044O_16 [Vibrio phage 2.044.O._10N.261.51.B8]